MTVAAAIRWPQIINNTCYDYGKGPGVVNPEGVSGYTDGGSATIKNNIFYSPKGVNPFDGSSFDASHNICASGKSCGSSSKTWSANTVLSTDPNSASFLMIASTSEARDAGTTVSVTTSYGGGTRPKDAGFDIGAFEVGGQSLTLPPQAPSNVRIIR